MKQSSYSGSQSKFVWICQRYCKLWNNNDRLGCQMATDHPVLVTADSSNSYYETEDQLWSESLKPAIGRLWTMCAWLEGSRIKHFQRFLASQIGTNLQQVCLHHSAETFVGATRITLDLWRTTNVLLSDKVIPNTFKHDFFSPSLYFTFRVDTQLPEQRGRQQVRWQMILTALCVVDDTNTVITGHGTLTFSCGESC